MNAFTTFVFTPAGLGQADLAIAASRAGAVGIYNAEGVQAVMIDTRRPLAICPEAEVAENTEYWKSWQT